MEPGRVEASIAINGAAIDVPPLDRGYAVIDRRWQAGDVITLTLPMPVRRVRSHEKIAGNSSRQALERGPIVYCLEAVDHAGHLQDLWIPPDVPITAEHDEMLLGGVTVLRGEAMIARRGADGIDSQPIGFTAVPYHAWAHRAEGAMAVWMPTDAGAARPRPTPTIASTARVTASHCWTTDAPEAVNDLVAPGSSNDHAIPRFTWWDHLGTREWIELELEQPTAVSSVGVYWFDDTGVGRCRVPRSWRVLVRTAEGWTAVSGTDDPGVERDTLNRVEFEPVTASAIRLEVALREGFSGGILELSVD